MASKINFAQYDIILNLFKFDLFVTVTQPQQQQTAVDPAADQLAKIAQAVHQPQIFGDERDAVIAKWNQLQAQWGKGKGYYTRQNFVEFKPDNLFCRFKVLLLFFLFSSPEP